MTDVHQISKRTAKRNRTAGRRARGSYRRSRSATQRSKIDMAKVHCDTYWVEHCCFLILFYSRSQHMLDVCLLVVYNFFHCFSSKKHGHEHADTGTMWQNALTPNKSLKEYTWNSNDTAKVSFPTWYSFIIEVALLHRTLYCTYFSN